MSLRNDNLLSKPIERIALVAVYIMIALWCLDGLFGMTYWETARLVIGIAFAAHAFAPHQD